MGVTTTTRPNFCNSARDSVDHILWSCKVVNNFWNALEQLFIEKCDNIYNSHISKDIVLFGVDENNIRTGKDFLIYFILIRAKKLYLQE